MIFMPMSRGEIINKDGGNCVGKEGVRTGNRNRKAIERVVGMHARGKQIQQPTKY